jgi:hypothetical protein
MLARLPSLSNASGCSRTRQEVGHVPVVLVGHEQLPQEAPRLGSGPPAVHGERGGTPQGSPSRTNEWHKSNPSPAQHASDGGDNSADPVGPVNGSGQETCIDSDEAPTGEVVDVPAIDQCVDLASFVGEQSLDDSRSDSQASCVRFDHQRCQFKGVVGVQTKLTGAHCSAVQHSDHKPVPVEVRGIQSSPTDHGCDGQLVILERTPDGEVHIVIIHRDRGAFSDHRCGAHVLELINPTRIVPAAMIW